MGEDVDCGGGICHMDERSFFTTTPTELRTIADAGTVIARLGGRSAYVEKEFNSGNFEWFRKFVSAHVR